MTTTSPGGEGGHETLELGALGGDAADLLLEDLLAPGRLELGELGGEVLGVGETRA
jgi:hypothetical protein